MSARKLKTSKKFKTSNRLTNDIEWNQLMQTVEEIKKETDKKLEEISSQCLKRECNAK